jgi:hypothetical protein
LIEEVFNVRCIEATPLPEVCQNCKDRNEALDKGITDEWYCDECDYLGLRFVLVPEDYGQ